MNPGKHDDIEQIIRELEHFRTNINDPVLGSSFWDEAMKDFITKHGNEVVTLLRELERRRDEQEGHS